MEPRKKKLYLPKKAISPPPHVSSDEKQRIHALNDTRRMLALLQIQKEINERMDEMKSALAEADLEYDQAKKWRIPQKKVYLVEDALDDEDTENGILKYNQIYISDRYELSIARANKKLAEIEALREEKKELCQLLSGKNLTFDKSVLDEKLEHHAQQKERLAADAEVFEKKEREKRPRAVQDPDEDSTGHDAPGRGAKRAKALALDTPPSATVAGTTFSRSKSCHSLSTSDSMLADPSERPSTPRPRGFR